MQTLAENGMLDGACGCAHCAPMSSSDHDSRTRCTPARLDAGHRRQGVRSARQDFKAETVKLPEVLRAANLAVNEKIYLAARCVSAGCHRTRKAQGGYLRGLGLRRLYPLDNAIDLSAACLAQDI